MKNETGNRIRLGIFVTIAVALFIVVIYFIGNRQQLFTKTITISGIFEDVGGLREGSNVRLSGITVGTISEVEIVTDSTVKVVMVIEQDVQKFIKKDAVASIGSDGLMGNKVISIVSGNPNSPVIADGGTIKTVTPVSMDDIMNNLAMTTANAAVITDDISVLTGNIIQGNGAIGKIFMDPAFAKTLDRTIQNAEKAAGGFSDNMEAVKHNVLLRGYFKKKEKEAEKAKKEADENAKKALKEVNKEVKEK